MSTTAIPTIDTTSIINDLLRSTESVLGGVSPDESKAQMMYAIGFASAAIELMAAISDACIAQTKDI